MVHEDHPTIAELTWAHDPRAVELAREEHRKSPEEAFGMLVSTLYSFRERSECVQELVHRWRSIARRLKNLMVKPGEPDIDKWANRVDTFATHLEWLSRRRELIEEEREEALLVAKRAVVLGLDLTQKEEFGRHTRALLQLTCARILIGEGELRSAGQYLRSAYGRAYDIKDLEQKPRVYRKIARLSIEAREFSLALRAFVRWLRTKRR